MKHRIEKDTMGEMKVDDTRYWGAQTQRSKENFVIDVEHSVMPKDIVKAFGYLKSACAIVNHDLDRLDKKKKDAIVKAGKEVLEGKLMDHFPLVVWQTGSGTQSNMNVNEVISNRATEILGADFRKEKLVHPNDHVNMGQSSNDTFPTALRIALCMATHDRLLPSARKFLETLEKKVKEFKDVVKIGRTHMQDATPLTLGQEFSGYAYMLKKSIKNVELILKENTVELAIGGTAVGTGINSHPDFGPLVCEALNKMTESKYGFKSSPNKFHGLTSHDGEVVLSGAFKALAADLYKIASDIRMLSCGPRAGITEILIPENEPGSSIMPGKVNPTQSESMTMVAAQVMGNDVAVAFAASQGHFELNVYKPVIAKNMFDTINILSDCMVNFEHKCLCGIEANRKVIDRNVNNSLMLVTALNPHIGYEKSAKIAKNAHKKDISLKESALELGYLTEEEYDKYIVPKDMTHPKKTYKE